jgi:hypothetical protein
MAKSTRSAPVSLRFHFRQKLRAPADAAFAWCTDFGSEDGTLFPERHERTARWFGPDTAILMDTTYPRGRPLRIQRLVRINPEQRAWTNTHLDGPYRHSQYWYRILPRGPRASLLEFTGHRLVWPTRRPSAAAIRRLTDAERRSDSGVWRTHIAPALARKFAPRRTKARRTN